MNQHDAVVTPQCFNIAFGLIRRSEELLELVATANPAPGPAAVIATA